MDPIRDLAFAFGFRLLARRPAFTGASILAPALGIGVTVAIFSAVDAFPLRPLPYPESGRLVTIWEVHHAAGQSRSDVSPVQFVDFRSQTDRES